MCLEVWIWDEQVDCHRKVTIENTFDLYSGDSENEDNDEDMDVGPNAQNDEVAQALSVADALGMASEERFDDITVGLRELDMENYDEEDEGMLN